MDGKRKGVSVQRLPPIVGYFDRGTTVANANRNHPRKMSHVAAAVERPGIDGASDRCSAIPMIAKTAATMKSQTFGACRPVMNSPP